ncbi:hypothetical protein ASPZODRAFT_664509 [Penicilliopsis zonata CBS 506.65]|uniref:Rhodopsin domain-containing protein n=1 Tax=Penicilliopsis zonata CBS 506.65 TaxID=1073090 RepID=A0A1L9SCU0_9EURO|nr:hypothetical protein ASPZODRAFT_664509 [Penicilliopsis zonata CBS 506.65]OJJ44996.1 hypothetical protein ASPZODRAFT_664509 [Penicilliopsis zonata CBS 506.65]
MVNDYRPALNAVGWSFGALATFVVFSRIYCRAFAVQKQGWDDWLMVFAWAAAIVTTALVTVSTTYGFGIHEADITSVSDLENAIKYILIAPAISLLASASAKLSVVLFLLRLLGLAATIPHRIILYTTTALMIGGNIFAMVVLLGYCNPPRKAWDPTVEGTCMSAQVLNIGGRAVTVYNAFMDLLCAAFPVLMLWTLNMRSKMKWGLAVVMSGGVLQLGHDCNLVHDGGTSDTIMPPFSLLSSLFFRVVGSI